MRRSAGNAVVMLILLASCGKQPAAPSAVEAAASTSPAGAASTGGTAPASSATAAGFHLELGTPGTVILKNDSDASVRVTWELSIERNDGGAWATASTMSLQRKCFDPGPADACFSIAAHTSYAPLPWTGWFGCTQCGTCDANAPAAPGTYRFVAVECESKKRHESTPLEIVDEGRFAHTAHVYAPKAEPNTITIDNESDVPVSFRTSVIVSRLDAKRGAFDIVPKAGMTLMSTCATPVPECVTVAPHASLHTMPFIPGCKPCAPCASPVSPGELQMSVSVCDSSQPLYNDVYGATFYGKSFRVDAKGGISQP